MFAAAADCTRASLIRTAAKVNSACEVSKKIARAQSAIFSFHFSIPVVS